jgi:hypothetical protein
MAQFLGFMLAVQHAWMGTIRQDLETINCLSCYTLLTHVVNTGPLANENPDEFNERVSETYRQLRALHGNHVVGRLQEECEPRNDAGDDEDRSVLLYSRLITLTFS